MAFALIVFTFVCSAFAAVHATTCIEVDADHVSLLQTRVVHLRDAVREASLVGEQVPEPTFAVSRQSDEDIIDRSVNHPRQAFRDAEGLFHARGNRRVQRQHRSAQRGANGARSLYGVRATRAEESWEVEVLKAAEAVKIDDEAERFKLAVRAGGAMAEENDHAKVDALFKEQVRAMTAAKQTAVQHWEAAAEQEGRAAAKSRSSTRDSEGIVEDPTQQETELRRQLIVDDVAASREKKIAKRRQDSARQGADTTKFVRHIHPAPHDEPHRLSGHGADAKAASVHQPGSVHVTKRSTRDRLNDRSLQRVTDALDRYLQPRLAKKANYDVWVGHRCGDCGSELLIGAGGAIFDNVTTFSAAEVCGRVCDDASNCEGFSFVESLGRCYYRTSARCDGEIDDDRDCYTKVTRLGESVDVSSTAETGIEQHAKDVNVTKQSSVSQTKMLKSTSSEDSLKSQIRYATEWGHHCGDCGPKNDLALVTGMVVNDSVVEVCGEMCDSYAECMGFSFANSSGRCYFLRATSCNGTADSNRDCYTKLDRRSKVPFAKEDDAAQASQHVATVSRDTPRQTNVSVNASVNKMERKPSNMISYNMTNKSASSVASGHELVNGSAKVAVGFEAIANTAAAATSAGNSSSAVRQASLSHAAEDAVNVSGHGVLMRTAPSTRFTAMANASHTFALMHLAPGAYHIKSTHQESYINATQAGGVSLWKGNISGGVGLGKLLWRLDAVPGSQDLFFVASAHQEQFLNSNGSAVSLWEPAHARDAAKGSPQSIKWRLRASSDGTVFLINEASGTYLGASGSGFAFSRGEGADDVGAHPYRLQWQLERAKTHEMEECDAYVAAEGPACLWTGNWSCPAQPLGSRGVAGGNGGHDSIGFRCCCHFGLWAIPAMPRNGTTVRA